MSCVRASEEAQKAYSDLEQIQKDLKEGKSDVGRNLSSLLRAIRLEEAHEIEKLTVLQDKELAKKGRREFDRDKVTNKNIKLAKANLKSIESYRNAIDGVRTLHEEAKKEAAVNRQIVQVEKEIAGEVKKSNKKATVETPELNALRVKLAELRSQLKETPQKRQQLQESAIKAHLARLDRTAADLERRITEKDFAPKRVNIKKVLTPEVQEKLNRVDKLKRDWERDKRKAEREGMTPFQRGFDTLSQVKRFSILSGLKSIFKLYAASLEVALVRPMTEGAGYALRSIPFIDRIADLAPIEGGRATDFAGDVANYYSGLISGGKEFKSILTGRGSMIDIKFGKDVEIPDNMILGTFGRLHEAVKNPTRVANYNFAFERYLNWAERNGLNPKEQFVKDQAEIEAFKYANRSIFKEDNAVTKIYNDAIRFGKQKGGGWGAGLAFALEQTLPIVKIPTNIVKQVFEYQFGTLTGSVRLLNAVNKGLENVSPYEAELIMRQLKNGTVGGLMFAIGALCEEQIGGIYMKGEEKTDNEYGSAFGIPRYLLENPAFAALQIGATLTRYLKNHLPDDENLVDNAKTIALGMLLTGIGVLEEAPFVKAMFSVPKIGESGERIPITLAEIYARPYIPNILQHFANMSDLEEPIDWKSWTNIFSSVVSPKATPRAPETVSEALLLAVPAFGQPEDYSRKGVPEK
jgi:hypothetical protein